MLKTRITLENISRILLNLIKILIFLMYKDSSPPNVHTVNIHIFLLVYQLRLLLALLCSLTLSVWLMSYYVISIVKRLFMERFSIVLVFAISTIALPISEPLLGKTPVTVAIL